MCPGGLQVNATRPHRVLSKNTTELKIRPEMAPNCLVFPVSHWFPAKTRPLRSACDLQKGRSRTAGSTFCGAQPQSERKVRFRKRLGGLLRFYYWEAV